MAGRIEDVEGPTQVDLEILARVSDGRSDSYLSREVIDLCRVFDDFSNFGLIANISDGDLEAAALPCGFLQEVEIVTGAGSREIIEHMNLRFRSVQQSAGPIGTDETRASENQNRTKPFHFHRENFTPNVGK